MKNKKKVWLYLLICLLLVALVWFLVSRKQPMKGMGAGNLAGMNMVTVTEDLVCVSDPATNLLCVLDGEQTMPVMERSAWFLNVYQDELYYVSMETGSLMCFHDGVNDPLITEDQCYYPQFSKEHLYYINANDGYIYRMTYKDGAFSDKTCLSTDFGALFFVYANDKIYYYDNAETGIFAWDMQENSQPVLLAEGRMAYINVSEDGYIYYKDITDENDMRLVRITPMGEKKVLMQGVFDYINYYNGYIYYSDSALGSGGYLYRIPADGSKKPETLTREWSTNVTIIDGTVYYVGNGGGGERVWKTLAVTE